MKYLKYLLILLFIPCIVLAKNDVEIKSVTLIDKSEEVTELESAKYNGLKIDFSLKFTAKDDYAKYKIVLVNNSDKDYEIDNTSTFNTKKFIKYDYEVENNKKVLKSKEELTINILITYIKELEDSDFVDGFYKETNSVSLELVNDNDVIDNPVIKMVTNPNTSTGYILLVIFAVILSMLVLVLVKNKRSKLFIIAILLTIPLTVYALEKIKIDVETYIEIERRNYFTLINTCPSEYDEENNWDKEVYEFKEGMSFNDYMNSDYYNSLDTNKKNRIGQSIKNDQTIQYLKYYNINLENCLNQIEYPESKPDMSEEESEEYNNKKIRANELEITCRIENGEAKSVLNNDKIYNNKKGSYYTDINCFR
jgi:hypothetical protein